MSVHYSKSSYILDVHPEYLICLTISPDGNFLVSSCYDELRLWDLRDGTLICSHQHYKRSIHFSLIVTSDWEHYVADCEDVVETKKLLTGEKVSDFRINRSHTMRSSLEGNLLITADAVKHPIGDEYVRNQFYGLSVFSPINVWNLKTGELVHALQGHPDHQVTSLILGRDGNTLLSHSHLHSTKLWDLRTGQELHTFSLLPSGYRYWIGSFVINLSGEKIATGCKISRDDRDFVNFEMWNLLTGETIHSFPKTSRERCIPPPWQPGSVMTPDSKILVSGRDLNLEVWDGQTGELVCDLPGHESKIRHLAVTQDGKTIASYADDGIRIWKRTCSIA
jgi:WD40 repeat protein